MTTTTPTAKDTSALSALFGDTARIVRTTEVTIPSDLRALFAKAVTAFASAPNTVRVTEVKASDADAATYARQIRQYASENNRSALVKVNGKSVTWRFSKITPSVRGKSRKTNPVSVTNVSDAKAS